MGKMVPSIPKVLDLSRNKTKKFKRELAIKTQADLGPRKVAYNVIIELPSSKPPTYQMIPLMEENKFLLDFKEPGPDGRRMGPFKANNFQKIIDDSIGPKSLRHIILKPRQIGISTYIDLRLLAKCLLVDGTRAAIISHERGATSRLLRKVHLALNDLMERKVKINGKLVATKYSTKFEISFTHTKSTLYIGTAGQRAFSRGDSLTDVHASEVSVWENPGEMMLGLEGALTPTAEVFLESTANGMGGYFYDMVQRCRPQQDGAMTGPYQFHFFPWKDSPEYQLQPPQDALWSPQELSLQRQYNLTTSQLWWRRKKLDKYERLEDFLQEFPLTIDEAFIVSGACFFEKESLREATTRAIDPLVKGICESVGSQAVLRAVPNGPVEIYRHPVYGGSYLIGADCSEGVDGGDPMSACVLDREKCRESAWMTGLLDPEETAKGLYALGQFYNWAWLAVEDNGPGLAVLTRLQQMGYPRLYRRVDPESQESKIGWHTDPRTRPLLLGAIRRMLKMRIWGVASMRFLKQCTTFCRQGNGHYEANSGTHDDDVFAAGIAAYLHGVIAPDVPQMDIDRERRIAGNAPPIRHGLKTGY